MGDLQPGTPMPIGYVALPTAGQGPGVLVLHAWWGLNDVFRAVCDWLAAAGFVVVAPDLWGGVIAQTVGEAERLIQHERTAAIEPVILDALAYLRAHPAVSSTHLGAIGFSMGAYWAVQLASIDPAIRAVTIFYGAAVADFSTAQASYQGHFAENDPWEPDEHVNQMVEAMRSAGRPAELHRYAGASHWFFEEDRQEAYNPAAAALAWERTLAFLREQLT